MDDLSNLVLTFFEKQLKETILRVDFEGIASTDMLLEVGKTVLAPAFHECREYEPVPTKLFDTPFRERNTHNGFEFRNCSIEGFNDAKVEMLSDCIIMTFKGGDFKTVAIFADLMSAIILQLSKRDPFITIERYGLRRRGGMSSNDVMVFFKMLNPNMLGGRIAPNNVRFIQRNVTDIYENTALFNVVNFSRKVRTINSKDFKEYYQLIWDFDVYTDRGWTPTKPYTEKELFTQLEMFDSSHLNLFANFANLKHFDENFEKMKEHYE